MSNVTQILNPTSSTHQDYTGVAHNAWRVGGCTYTCLPSAIFKYIHIYIYIHTGFYAQGLGFRYYVWAPKSEGKYIAAVLYTPLNWDLMMSVQCSQAVTTSPRREQTLENHEQAWGSANSTSGLHFCSRCCCGASVVVNTLCTFQVLNTSSALNSHP